MKTCTKCGEEKPYIDFHRHKQTKDGFKSRCKECNCAEAKEFRDENLETVRAKDRARYGADSVRWNQWQKHGTSTPQERLRKWKKAHPGRANADTAARRAAKLNATPAWINKEFVKEIYEEAKWFDLEVDHIIPLRSDTVCGLHWEGNMQLLSPSENYSKGNKYQ